MKGCLSWLPSIGVFAAFQSFVHQIERTIYLIVSVESGGVCLESKNPYQRPRENETEVNVSPSIMAIASK